MKRLVSSITLILVSIFLMTAMGANEQQSAPLKLEFKKIQTIPPFS